MDKQKFTFIDLFAGIGGFHLALHDLGGECVFVNEFDRHAKKTYEHNFSKISPELFPQKTPVLGVFCYSSINSGDKRREMK